MIHLPNRDLQTQATFHKAVYHDEEYNRMAVYILKNEEIIKFRERLSALSSASLVI
jgi:hypothetical protein